MKKVYEASLPGCSRALSNVVNFFSDRSTSMLPRMVVLLCLSIVGHTVAYAQPCAGVNCSIAYAPVPVVPPAPPLNPGEIILCLNSDGVAEITPSLMGGYTTTSNGQCCTIVKVWENADATNLLTPADANYQVDCGDVGSTFQVWVTREVNLPPPGGPGRSAALPFTILVADCDKPMITCPAPQTLTCASELLPAPPNPMTEAEFEALGGQVSDNCSVDEVTYTDSYSGFVCLNKFTVTRTFTAVDPSGNTRTCTQVITVSDNVAPTFTADPIDLTLECPDITSIFYPLEVIALQLQIQAWLDNAGGAAVTDNCGGSFINGNGNGGLNLAACLLFDPVLGCLNSSPVFASTVWDQIPDECSPGPREVQVGFFVKDECDNQSYRVAKVILIDDENPSPSLAGILGIPPLPGYPTLIPPSLSAYTCADLVPGPNPEGIRPYVDDNCSPQEDLTIAWVEDVPTTVDGCNSGINVDIIDRRYRVTDCAGNSRIFTQQIRVRDNVAPNWTNDPNNLELECDADLNTAITAWLASKGEDGAVSDNCNGVTVTTSPATTAGVIAAIPAWCLPPANPLAGTPYRSTTVTFTATDGCGNTQTRTARVRLRDLDAPSATAPAAITVDCSIADVPVNTADVTGLSDDCTPTNQLTVVHDATTLVLEGNGCPGDERIYRRNYRVTDCAGNERVVTQMITISDDAPPVWAGTPGNLNLNCTQSTAAKNTAIDNWLASRGGASASDVCGAVTYTTNPMTRDNILDALGACAPLAGSVVVTFIATDACGNSATKTATLTITDGTNPTASNPAPSNFNCLNEVPDPNPNIVTDEADGCSPAGTIKVTYQPNMTTDNDGAGCVGDPLEIYRRYKVEDCSGNFIIVTHTIVVVDNVEPDADCKGVTAYLGANGEVTINASQFNDGSSDNCGGMLTYQFARDEALDDLEVIYGSYTTTKTFDCDDIAPNIENCSANTVNSEVIGIRLKVFDACGNESGFCTTALTLIDNILPTIDCPDDITFMTSSKPGYDCQVNATWPHPDVDDNCTISCYEMEVQKEINGVFVTIDPATGAPTPFYRVDVLGVAEANYMFEKGPYCNASQIDDDYKVIYYVRDEHGNTAAACDFLIKVKDDEAPIFTSCPSAPIVAETTTGDCYQFKCWAPPTFYDNCQFPYFGEGSGYCPIPTLVVTTSDPTVMVDTIGDDHCALFPVGETFVYYTVTDICGNTATCTVTVQISDPEAPVAMCAGPFTVNMEPDSVMQLSVADIDAPGTMDNCGICFKGISRNPAGPFGPTVTLTCADVNTTVAVTMKVQDCSAPANDATCVAMVTVQDMQLPGNAYCPADIEVGTDPNVCNAVVTYNTPTFNDGCGSAHNGTLISPVWAVSGAAFPIGNTTVTYSYTSASGYTVYCNFVVTVVDDQVPTLVCPSDVTLTCLQSVPAPLTVGAFTGGTLSDNCGVTSLEYSDYDNDLTHCPYDGIRVVTRRYTAFDAAGNSSTCEQKFTYTEDNTPPVLTVKPLDISFECADEIPPVPLQSATDNCGDVVIDFSEEVQPGGCENKLVVIRTWVAHDACGNTASWEQRITVEDTEPPVLGVTPPDRTYECFDEVLAAPLDQIQQSSDNCDVFFVDFSESTEGGSPDDPNWSCPNNVVITRRWVASDLCGNTTEHIQVITVHDDIRPVFTVMPVDRTYECLEDVLPAPDQHANLALDNCEVVFVDFMETRGGDSCNNQVLIIRRWEATDACGNKNTHWQYITVYDNEPPVLATTPVDRTYECFDEVPPAPFQTVTDNCGTAFVDFSESTSSVGNISCPNQVVISRRWYAWDICGNSTEHIQTITVNDIIRPVLAVTPLDITVTCSEGVPDMPLQTALDNCDIANLDTYETTEPGGCEDHYVVVRRWVATDACGNTKEHSQRITVVDNTPPVFSNVPASENHDCAEDVPPVVHPDVSDNCSEVFVDFSEETLPGGCEDKFMVKRVWVATDLCGNQAATYQLITIKDTEKPVLHDLPDATVEVACSELVPLVAPVTVTDNCNQPLPLDFSEVEIPGTCSNQYQVKRTWKAQDDCGNATSFVQIITVKDMMAPVLAGLPDATVSVQCADDIPLKANVTASDNCVKPIDLDFYEVEIPGDCPNQYQIKRVWTAMDDCANATWFVQTITVNDDMGPVVTPPAGISLNCTDISETTDPSATVTNWLESATATDNCDQSVVLTYSYDQTTLDVCTGGSLVVTWTATDACGNTGTATSTITVVPDTEDPIVTAPAGITLDCDDISETTDPGATISNWLASATASDNCDTDPELTYNFNATTLDVCVGGTLTVTWTATDHCGNVGTATSTITVVPDTEDPSIVAPAPLTLDCDDISPITDPAATVSNWLESATASDNCDTDPELTFDFDLTTLNVCVGGTLTVTWTATDHCGNTSTATSTITIIPDELDPELVGLPNDANVSVECADEVPAVPVVTATDNCTAPIDVEFFEVTVPGDCPNQYQVVRTWTAEDFCGNSSIFVQTITVSDTEAPELYAKPLRRHYQCVEEVEIAPYQFATDNCDVATVEFSETSNPGNCPNWITIERRWVAYDLCGNSSTWEQIIEVRDTIAPVFVVTPVDRTYECLDDVANAPDQGTIATDNCDVVFVDFMETRDNDSCQNQVIIIRRWEATDLCGNKNTHWQTITVYDDVPPVLATTPTDRSYKCLEDVETAPVQVATDNCGIVTYNFEETANPGTCLNQVVITRRWYAYDLCGNSVEHWQTITVNDDVDPVVTAPAAITLDCGDISETTDPAATVADWLASATATDNCDPTVVITHDFDVTTLDVCVGGTLTVTWTAADGCGNLGTASSTITVIPDTEDPIVTAPAGITLDCDDISETTDPAATISNWLESATATDNCDTDPELTYNFDATTLDVCVGGTLTVTWTATDHCGNVGTATSTITVVPDTEKPSITVPAPLVLDCGDINETVDPSAQIADWLGAASASDNCDTDPELSYDFDISMLNICAPATYTITVTWTANDACGNNTTKTQTITVVPDTEKPSITVPAPLVLDCGDINETVDPSAQIADWLGAASASDNCDTDPELSYDFDISMLNICAPATYTVTVTWTANDACGNNTTKTQTITVVPDTEKPSITVPAPLVLDCGDINETVDPSAQIADWLGAASASDNCDTDPELSYDFDISMLNICAPATYTITVTWTANDACGNNTTKTQTITVVPDTEKPSITVPAPLVLDCGDISETADPAAQIDAWLATASASDNCDTDPELSHSFNISELNICAPATYTITVTWTANDACGNNTTKTQTITVVPDTEKPSITVPAALVLDCGDINETTDPAAVLADWLAAASASDNCDTDPELSYDFDIADLNVCAPATYTITVTWTANDACGNNTTKSQTITVVPDTEDPVVIAPAAITLDCGDINETTDPAAVIDSWLISATATDNCDTDPALTYNFDITALNVCAPATYTITVTWTATDHCGNVGTSASTITVVPDTEDPIVVAPSPITLDCDDISETTDPAATVSNWLASATATDNCDTDPSLTYNFDVTTLDVCVGGTLTVTWTSTDHCGNVGTATSTITVVPDTEDPSIIVPAPLTLDCEDIGPVTDPAATVLNWLASASASDNCDTDPELTYNFDITTLNVCIGGTLTVTWTATDACGNTSTATSTIIVVPDTEAPQLAGQPNAVVNVKCAADVPVVAVLTASDNCTAPVDVEFSEVEVPGSCANKYTLIRTWTAEDACGNVGVFVQTINVNDDVAPVMSCPAPLFAQCSPGEHPPYANLIEFTTAGGSASDNCGLNVNSFGLLSETQNGNVYTRTYRVIDQCGNSATCTQTVTVIDTEDPIFLNCPVGPLVFGNDPDKCSAKINWPTPVAVDNCSIPTVVQTAGPTAGSVVPVGTYTVAFTATDAAGNVSICSFVVMVMDTQNPEFDADIVMPADVTVECDNVPAPFVLTTADVHDNCTPSNLLVITFTEVRTNGSCKFNYTLTRTWKVTDQAGNMLIHTQIVTVRDTKAPTALCKNATVTLDKFGNATVTASQINNGSFDNCSAQADLTYTVTPSAFTCANLGANVVTLRVTDECGNSATCTAIVTVLEGPGPCTPQITVKTTCKNNATTQDNGQFEDLITVKSLAMQTWTVTSSTGLYSANSPAPPAAPLALSAGTAFTAGTADLIDNDGDGQIDEADEMVYYTLKGVHVEAIGYSVAIKNNLNQTSTISNKGFYPSPYFINLNDPFCLNTPPFTIQVGEYNNAQGNVINIMVNGVLTNIFDAAALGVGFHTVMATFDAGTATTNLVINGQLVGGTEAQALADPGCQQKITKIVQITDTPPVVVCNDLVHISIANDGGDCVFVVEPDDVLEGSYGCFDDYSVVLTYPNGTHTFTPPNRVDYTHIGKFLNYSLVHAISGNVCWGQIKVEDKEPPILTCPNDITINCSDPTNVNFTGKVLVSDCHPTVTIVDTDDYTDFGSCSSPRAQIIRTWLVTDGAGNQSTCSQTITIKPFDLVDVDFPNDVTIECSDLNSTDPNVTGVPTINGSPIGTGGLCMASISKTDEIYDLCTGSYEIIRTWKVRNMCLPVGPGNPVEHAQVIKVTDTHGPTFDCPSDVTVSTDPFSCCSTAPLPDVIITELCSYVTSLTYKIVGIDVNTGNLVIHEGFGGLANFPGNNLWHPDTMGVFGFSQCLPRGEYTVTYTAIDGCGNISNCTFKLTVEDQIPPISACDEFTQVALGGDGMAFVNASTFDDGSYDVCNPVSFKARRMNPNDCQTDTLFHDQVKFCCSDINDTILVVFRTYDFQAQAGTVGLDYGLGHWNDCMVQVFVEDKIKPICTAPAHTTVTCENFDPSLWAYGFATAADNCCLDTITVTNNLGLFDTVCNKGTITRTFRAIDCGGQSSTCTQRIIVTYEQDYFVKFPNDVIVTVCDGSGNYGEPTFFGEDCELLGVSHEDEVFTVVPDACFKIERTWTIINWCTYNPNAGCIEVPNPNPNATVNHPSNLPGPTVSAAGTPAPWNPTVVAINPGQTPTNYSTFWSANANCYKYKQIIKVIDTQDPVVQCPASPVEVCDLTPNDPLLWNKMYWYDSKINSHDLCEAPTDLCITATDLCSGASLNIHYLLFLDLDGDGTMESVVNSINTGIAGLGWNAIPYNNINNPNYSGGEIRQFDDRPVLFNQKYGFALQTTVSGTNKTACLRWNTQQAQNTYVVPELPYGTHKIKWFIEDGCGNETICEYTFVVKDCKKPTVVCLNGLSVNIMPTKMIQLWASDFLQYTEDNCTPSNQLVIGIRKSGTGTGFPLNPDGTPQTSVTFTCDELGTQLVELWSIDKAGNADYCETYVIVQDNAGICSGTAGTVAGALKTEVNNGLEDANVELDGSSNALPPTTMFDFSDDNGQFEFNGVPYLGDYTVTPTKDNDPLNGVSTFDLVLINKHILGLEPLTTPYKMIAADANNSRSITTFDIVELRKLILGIYTELPNNTSWRFVDGAYQFPNQSNPFQEIFPETKQIADMQISMMDEDFVAVKVGDVNLNAVANSLMSVQDRTDGTLLFDVQDRTVKAGETFTVNFKAAERVMGYQFTLFFPNMEVTDVTAGTDMKLENFGIFNSEHALTTSFDNEHAVGEFSVTFRAKTAGTLSEMLTVSSRITKAEAYNLNRERQAVGLRFNGQNGATITGLGFELYQNQPNPWMTKTQIGFYLPEATEATLTIFDETGRTLFTQTGDFTKGYNAIALERSLVNTTGVLYYKLETANDSAVKKMIQTK